MTREEAIADFKEEVYKFREYLEAKKINPLKPSDDEEYKEYIHFCHEIEKDIERDEIAISALSAEGEYIKKEDMEKILYTTNNAVRIGELFTELPTYSFPDSAEDNTMEWIYEGDEISGVFRCSKCGMESENMDFEHFHFCPNCGRKAVSE